MKVILLSDVKNVGKKDQIVEVNNGFASNFLFPKKLAVMVTKTSLDIKENQEEERLKNEEIKKQDAIEIKKQLEKITLVLKASVGKEGKLFGSISSKAIVEEYDRQYNIKLDKRKLINFDNIVQLGNSKIEIELYKGVIGILNINVLEK